MSTLAQPFKIQLDEPHRTWTAGDRIGGKVILCSRKEESVGAVTVTLLARAEVKFRPNGIETLNTHLRSTSVLLEETQTLYSSHFTLRPDEYTWPLGFTLPVTPAEFPGQKWLKAFGFAAKADHPLPPSMSYACPRNTKGTTFECMIEYALVAKLTRPPNTRNRFSAKDEDTEVQWPLSFEMRRPRTQASATTTSKTLNYCIKSLLLDPSRTERLTFSERMRSNFQSSTLPAASFDLVWTFPMATNLGSALHCKVKLVHLSDASTAPPPSNVSVVVNVSIVKQVIVRPEQELQFLAHNVKSSPEEILFQQQITLHLLNKEHDYSAEIMTDKLDAAKYQPSFATYNIKQQHVLEISCTVDCAGQTQTAKATAALVIHPQVQALSANRVPEVEAHGAVDEALPLYSPTMEPVNGTTMDEAHGWHAPGAAPAYAPAAEPVRTSTDAPPYTRDDGPAS